MVVEQVPEAGDEAGRFGLVVVGAEERRKPGLVLEGGPDAAKGVGVHDDVGVDEHEHLAACARRALVPRRRRSGAVRGVDDDQLLRRLVRGTDRRDAPLERRRVVRGGDDRG